MYNTSANFSKHLPSPITQFAKIALQHNPHPKKQAAVAFLGTTIENKLAHFQQTHVQSLKGK
jgi:hypothetical protein